MRPRFGYGQSPGSSVSSPFSLALHFNGSASPCHGNSGTMRRARPRTDREMDALAREPNLFMSCMPTR
ncbi:unnamed protein product [Toxocara canis]|uniref:Uncharacterized protein n=1 Tax=Toxocara canis TaxID=6265 RepID=A0A183UUL2_TOXCA|nr:unnamed protein product [Toxocara canis]